MKRKHRQTLENINELEKEVFPELVKEPEPEYYWQVKVRMNGASKYEHSFTWECETPDDARAFAQSIFLSEHDFITLDGGNTIIRRDQICSINIHRYVKRNRD